MSSKVALPVGLPQSRVSHQIFPFTPTWTGPKDDPTWNRRFLIEDRRLLDELQQLLDITYQKIWTRDRKTSGINRVPDEYRLESALRSENYRDWCAYYSRRLHLLDMCRSRPGFIPYPAKTGCSGLKERHQLQDNCNEWLLFHGTSQSAARAICASDFTMDLAGSATGTLYGKGTYFAESITKADEYAKENEDGLCCVLVCRVVGGRVLLNTEDTPDAAMVQRSVLSGAADSVLGSRDVTKNTFREFVTYDVDQVYVEYVLFYRRVFHRGRASDATPPSGKPSTGPSSRSIEFAGFGVVGLESLEARDHVEPVETRKSAEISEPPVAGPVAACLPTIKAEMPESDAAPEPIPALSRHSPTFFESPVATFDDKVLCVGPDGACSYAERDAGAGAGAGGGAGSSVDSGRRFHYVPSTPPAPKTPLAPRSFSV
jgi:hypothetical protein